jgi:SAM-dependent methyltransferase
MMFGSRARYEYFRCSGCECCHLLSLVDPAAQYPPDYHAHVAQPRQHGLRGWLRRRRNAGVFRGDPVGRVLSWIAPYPVFAAERWFARMRVAPTSSILDVGCGSGELVRDLLQAGFTDVHGIDPLIPDELLASVPRTVRRASLRETAGEYDVVMLHHVLEHIALEDDALVHVARLLKPGGHCLVRVPIMPSYAWAHYREHWVQLDAPRHLVIHSEKSLARVAAAAGLRLDHVEHDSTEFQFTGSELYARDMSLTQLPRAFTQAQIRGYRRAAKRLNRERRGDQAAFYFRKQP